MIALAEKWTTCSNLPRIALIGPTRYFGHFLNLDVIWGNEVSVDTSEQINLGLSRWPWALASVGIPLLKILTIPRSFRKCWFWLNANQPIIIQKAYCRPGAVCTLLICHPEIFAANLKFCPCGTCLSWTARAFPKNVIQLTSDLCTLALHTP